MLSIGKIMPLAAFNKTNTDMRRKDVSFLGGFHLDGPQKFQFFNNIFAKEKTFVAKNLKEAVELIPSSSNEAGSFLKEACEFFKALKVISQEHPEKNFVEVLCEHFSIGVHSFQRDFVNEPFEKHFNAIENREEYSDFVETLTKGLYEETSAVVEQSPITLPSQSAKPAIEDFKNVNVRSTIDIKAIEARFESELDVVLDTKIRSVRKYSKKNKKPLPSKEKI